MTKKILILFLPLALFWGCSSKRAELSNLTALKWHKQIYKDIRNGNLDSADDDFLSMQVEHPNSIYVKIDLLNLYMAHLANKEYVLAKFYINEYEKRFASAQEIPWIEFQKIKVDFLKYQNAYTDQKAILDLIKEAKTYLNDYPNSHFTPEVSTILAKAELTKKYLDAKISKLYNKLDKPKAAKQYETKIPKHSEPPYVPWYKKLFYW